jgi:2-dehydropantoate 2-reductase
MKIAIFGAGAIGGYLGVKLARAGANVTLIARGLHLAAMRDKGVTLVTAGERVTVHPFCTDDPEKAGVQDYVILTLKAHSLPKAALQVGPLMTPQTTLVTTINGVPYWYFYGIDSPWRDRPVESVDPGGALLRALPPRQVLGAVVYPAAEVVAPGVIEHAYGDRITLGEPDGSRSCRAETLSRLLTQAGLKARIRPRIREEMWVKLWGNLAFNPLSALTLSTLDRLAKQSDLRAISRAMMVEAQEVAEALGIRFPITVDKRIDGAAGVGAHKTSMLQDLEHGRPMEIDAMLGAVVELGALVGKRMPAAEIVLALVRERARRAGCYLEHTGFAPIL